MGAFHPATALQEVAQSHQPMAFSLPDAYVRANGLTSASCPVWGEVFKPRECHSQPGILPPCQVPAEQGAHRGMGACDTRSPAHPGSHTALLRALPAEQGPPEQLVP